METDTSGGVLRHSGLWALSSTEMANQPFVKTVMGSRLRGIRELDKGIHGIAQPPQHRRRAAAHETLTRSQGREGTASSFLAGTCRISTTSTTPRLRKSYRS